MEVLGISNNRRDCEALRNIVSRTNWILHCAWYLSGAMAFLNDPSV
jgi:hypothetical protein